ncbi:hypothetical protein F4805DRAFT_10421 [Annulohypoxylon moriforme]|nr:hypothetical protein F4805DRAFT_10421 [Annulohypoxylon moriforme]
MSSDVSAPDWISSISSLVAAFIGIVTLLTVYIGAMQLLSQNRMYRIGLSRRSLGPWRPMAARSTLFGLQRRIFAPSVSLNALVKQKWKPNLVFPAGFSRTGCPERGDYVQAKTTWVNFLQALNLSPDDEGLFEMQDTAELVNGIVPMHWTGQDLVGFCSILGFQSHESSPSFKSPMPLPMQWSGPLGWLQFRSSANGCIAEFRRRMDLKNQILADLHNQQRHRIGDLTPESHSFDSRLWNSISGFSLQDGQYLYLGGTDRHTRPQEIEDNELMTELQMHKYFTTNDLSDEEITRKLFGKKGDLPKALRRDVETRGIGRSQRPHEKDIPDFLDLGDRDAADPSGPSRKQILRPCRGLLSVSVQGELAYNRGLNIENCKEYDRKYVQAEDIDHQKYPYNLDDLYMDSKLLQLMKKALLLLRPDGFYFSPTYHLYSDLFHIYRHVENQSNKVKEFFPEHSIPPTSSSNQTKGPSTCSSACSLNNNYSCIYFAMTLCNNLQGTRKTARACFTVDDMRLLALAASDLKKFLSPKMNLDGQDLVWAFIYSPKFFDDILESLKTASFPQFLEAKATAKGGILDCAALLPTGDGQDDNEKTTSYEIPEVTDAEFTGAQVLASLSIILITYFWIEKRWPTDVAAYEWTMPQNVLMT